MDELKTGKHIRLYAKLELAIILLLAIIPLFTSFPYRVNIFLSWEGAYRLSQGQVPYRGKVAALASGALADPPTIWLTDALAASRSDDFGYVRGTYASAAEPQKVLGYFMRVWRREGGTWRVVLDVTNPR